MSHPFQIRTWNPILKDHIPQTQTYRTLKKAIATAQQLMTQDTSLETILVYDLQNEVIRWQAPHFERYLVYRYNHETENYQIVAAYQNTADSLAAAIAHTDKLIDEAGAESVRVYDRQTHSTVYYRDPIPF